MSEPQTGNHNGLHEIKERVGELMAQLGNAGIAVDGLFCDLDAGFDARTLTEALESHGVIPNVCPNRRNGTLSDRERLFDDDMYGERWKIERANAWMDGFKTVLTRFDTTISSWKGWNFLAFIVIFLKKFH